MCLVLKAASFIVIKKGFKVTDTIDCKIFFQHNIFSDYLGILHQALFFIY